MKLKKITIQNFMSVRKASIDLDNQGLILIQGDNKDEQAFDSNGSGKSTIFEAITVCLYDKSIRGMSKQEMINREVGKNMCLFLDMEEEDATYRIARYGKHNEHKNNVYVYRNGKNITPKSIKDTNNFIQELIQMDYMTFTNSVLFGGGVVKTFTNATDAEKKTILENMLDLGIWSEAQKLAKLKRKEIEDELQADNNKVAQNERMELEIANSIDSLQEMKQKRIEDNKVKVAEAEKELDTFIKNKDKELKNLSHTIDLKERENLELCMVTVTLETNVELKKDEVENIRKELEVYSEAEERMNELKINNGEYKQAFKSYKERFTELKEDLENLLNEDMKKCPNCGEILESNDDKIEKLQNKIRQVGKKVKAYKKIISDTNKELLEIAEVVAEGHEQFNKFEALNREIFEMESKAKANNKRIEEQKEYLAELNKRLETINEGEEEERIKNNIENLKKDGATLDIDAYINEKREQLKKLRGENDDIIKSTSDKRKLLEKLDFAVQAFSNSGIKSYLLDAVTPILNERANYYLYKLSGNTSEIKFTTQTRLASGEVREKFDVQIINQNGGDSYKSNSNGERRRIDLAIALALQDLALTRSNAKFNMLLFDEVFDGLDATGTENVVNLLQEIQEKVGTIFVISHNDSLKALFDKKLIVTKENGRTSVTKEG